MSRPWPDCTQTLHTTSRHKMAINTGPRSRKSRSAEGNQAINNLPQVEVSFDMDAFKNAIRAHGIKVTHYRAIPDPSGMLSRGDSHNANGLRSSSDGFIYKEAGQAWVLFTNNSNQTNVQPEGTISNSTAYMTLPDTYEGTDNPVIVSPWDRFYLENIEVRSSYTQYLEASPLGIDRLHFPATCVEHLIDANGVEYFEDKDFKITEDGEIKWLTQKRPGFNTEIGKGTVYSIRYRYTPFFICSYIIHEIRVASVTDAMTMERAVVRAPYQIQVVREHVYRDMNRDEQLPMVDPRFQYAPPIGASNVLPDLPPVGGKMGPRKQGS